MNRPERNSKAPYTLLTCLLVTPNTVQLLALSCSALQCLCLCWCPEWSVLGVVDLEIDFLFDQMKEPQDGYRPALPDPVTVVVAVALVVVVVVARIGPVLNSNITCRSQESPAAPQPTIGTPVAAAAEGKGKLVHLSFRHFCHFMSRQPQLVKSLNTTQLESSAGEHSASEARNWTGSTRTNERPNERNASAPVHLEEYLFIDSFPGLPLSGQYYIYSSYSSFQRKYSAPPLPDRHLTCGKSPFGIPATASSLSRWPRREIVV